jgi:uncharacterized protein (DUF2147 family)
MSFMRTATIAAVLLGLSLGTSLAADPTGTWLTEEGKATVRIAACGPALCGTIVSLKEANDPDTGKPRPTRTMPKRACATGRWSGFRSCSA